MGPGHYQAARTVQYLDPRLVNAAITAHMSLDRSARSLSRRNFWGRIPRLTDSDLIAHISIYDICYRYMISRKAIRTLVEAAKEKHRSGAVLRPRELSQTPKRSQV